MNTTTSSNSKIQQYRANSQEYIRINGDFSVDIADDARQIFDTVIESTKNDVVLDLSHSSYIDSSGIGAIVFLYKRLRCGDRKLLITGASNQPLELIQLLRIDTIIPINR